MHMSLLSCHCHQSASRYSLDDFCQGGRCVGQGGLPSELRQDYVRGRQDQHQNQRWVFLHGGLRNHHDIRVSFTSHDKWSLPCVPSLARIDRHQIRQPRTFQNQWSGNIGQLDDHVVKPSHGDLSYFVQKIVCFL